MPDAAAQIQALFAAWNTHDVDAVAAYYRADATRLNVPAPEHTANGIDAIRAFVAGFYAAFPDAVFAIGPATAGPGTASAEWVITATHRGPYAGFRATGRPIRVTGTTDIQYDDAGLIAAETVYWDLAGFLQQLGMLG